MEVQNLMDKLSELNPEALVLCEVCVIELMALKETARSLNHNLIIYKYE